NLCRSWRAHAWIISFCLTLKHWRSTGSHSRPPLCRTASVVWQSDYLAERLSSQTSFLVRRGNRTGVATPILFCLQVGSPGGDAGHMPSCVHSSRMCALESQL